MMEDNEKGNSRRKDDIYSKSLRAGNRTYFFDVKSTKSEELYLTVTESKRRFNNESGKFFYEKHKLFIYPEDFSSFKSYLEETLEKIHDLNGGKEIISREEIEDRKNKNDYEDSEKKESETSNVTDSFSDINFDDLDREE